MKKYIPILICLFLLTACGGEESTATPTPSDCVSTTPAPDGDASATPVPEDYIATSDAAKAVADYLGWDDLSPLEEEMRDFFLNYMYWLEEDSWTDATVYRAEGADARELVVLRVSDKEYENAIYAALGEYCKARQGDFFGYFPREAALVEKAIMMSMDGYVALFICDDPKGAAKALEAVLSGEEPPEPTPTPSPTPTPLPTPAQPSEPASTPDISSFVPFDPPNEHIMIQYDTTAIREAYASGDESELSKRDAAVLARCKEAMEECVTEYMTDFEKELALRNWMLKQGTYDETVLSGQSRLGRMNNTDPYGYLVKGYGICLGYASTFQLLMELAGVECITVVGAAFDSTEDHAWNMVKLEGEWYCVDTTWDWEGSYNYFNVTSEYMRRRDHQWDYENVPEATATRFYWDGILKRPE